MEILSIENNTIKKTTYSEVSDEEALDSGTPAISCMDIVKLFKTEDLEVFALQGLDLTIMQGELISIIGKSGSGKSTLLNIIGGLEKPTMGKIVVHGKNLIDFTEKEMNEYRKHTIGFVWQKSSRNLFPYLTSLENIEMAMTYEKMSPKEKRERATFLLESVGMIHKKDVYPTKMSGGEQQRVAIAVALANNPKILLADEPTGAVDTKTSNEIQALFRKLNQELGLTIIIVTHDIKLAKRVDRVVMISDGKISTEKIRKEEEHLVVNEEEAHDEFSILDRAHRVQLSEEVLEAAGIDSNKVKISVEDGKIVIRSENS